MSLESHVPELEFNPMDKIMLSVEENNLNYVKSYLLKYPAGTNDEKKSLAFLYACRTGRIDIAKILLEYVNPNTRYSDGQTSLMLLSQLSIETKDISELMESLIEKGCEVDLVDFCGKSALHWAVLKNCSWSSRILLNHKCNVNSIDLLGFSPLMYGSKLDYASLVSLLLHYGADSTKSSKQHGTAIHLCIRHGAANALKQLLPFCRHLNILDVRNQSPIDLAVMLDNAEIVRILLESKKEIEVNRRPCFSPFRTPLEEACFKNSYQIVEALLLAGADVNHPLEFAFEAERQSNRSNPVAPLMFAVQRQNTDILMLLLMHGADVDVKCPKFPGYVLHTSPMAVAWELGNMNIIEMLESFRRSAWIYFSIDDSFSSVCLNHHIDMLHYFLNDDDFPLDKHLLKNGAPVFLELFRPYSNCEVDTKLISALSQYKDILKKLFKPEIAAALSNKKFGTSMQFYRHSWMELARLFPDCIENVHECHNDSYVQFIISFLECFFLKRRIDHRELITSQFKELEIFPNKLVRKAIHSARVIKAILYSKTLYALTIFVDMHLNEELVFWDLEQPLDMCEYALFFDNIEAALVLNLTCNISLKCVNEYETLPYTPEIMNKFLDYNDIEKITVLKNLSRTVKPLKSLAKYAIRKLVISDRDLLSVPLSKPVLDTIYLNLSEFICYFQSSSNSYVRYADLCIWTGIDAQTLCFTDF